MLSIRTIGNEVQTQDNEFYQIFLLRDPMEMTVDFTNYKTAPYSLLCLSPYQHLSWLKGPLTTGLQLLFHGDFYCIEYHKKEVACNGLLFNNIYLQPHVNLGKETYLEIEQLVRKMEKELKVGLEFSDAVVKAYLQLILALSSQVKKHQINLHEIPQQEDIGEGRIFQQLLEANFMREKSVNFYAQHFNLSIDAFSKKIKKQLGKAPSIFIQDRIILESKKLLHLTYQSIKEIAVQLNFDDEHYFSRYFKKNVGISPSEFRSKVGISIAAK
ncbi:helix-turn-helix domain-containing protein [Olivibacter jilunii]|uniref:helix-turn-helix domain-containing protein n=1 Tax=Olivibacter jilunii TaxID=985016 RepID=UPI003F16B45E